MTIMATRRGGTSAALTVVPAGPGADATGAGPDHAVVLDRVTKRYGSAQTSLALEGISLSVRRGEFVCLVGASGCGKSTLLNLVSGLDKPTSGRVSAEARPAFMFQEHALLPWLSALDNVAMPMRLAGVDKPERTRRATEFLAAVHLADAADRRPHELSGGMRQRVALARTLATESPVLLMDEPFGALDAMTRDLLHDELESIWRQRGLTVLFVTHNVREAVRLADRVVLLSSRPGRVVQEYPIEIGRPRRYDNHEVSHAAAEITAALRQEVARHGA
ncbi:MAG TPA: ABC transporter ATP-binding protein [Candidatus Lustribacter sp.]|nr:ABC transporter ATP-binding protein [Candidatus Lustribacter sp.]